MIKVVKFRGKAMGNSWVYGLLTRKKLRNSGEFSYAIRTSDNVGSTVPVREDSISQFTGIIDSSNTEIYENDFLQLHLPSDSSNKLFGRVRFFNGKYLLNTPSGSLVLGDILLLYNSKVVGNTLDTPDLILKSDYSDFDSDCN